VSPQDLALGDERVPDGYWRRQYLLIGVWTAGVELPDEQQRAQRQRDGNHAPRRAAYTLSPIGAIRLIYFTWCRIRRPRL
jgi:hypothetical protein